MLRHIRLIILDLDYVVFDCAQLKAQALRQAMISLADLIPQNMALPGTADAEAGFLDHGFRWIHHLELGLDEQNSDDLARSYQVQEGRLLESRYGKIFPGIEEFVTGCRKAELTVALGADADRDYMVAVVDRYELESLFAVTLCTEDFGMGDADEMMLEIMHRVEVNPSETLVFGTRPHTFQAANGLDIRTIGCGWGIRDQSGLSTADLRSHKIAGLTAAIRKADDLAFRTFGS